MTAVIYGVVIQNPTGVWHELKNVQRRLEEKGWIQDWFDVNSGGMCLANALRFVVHGQKDTPLSFEDTPSLVAENLVYAVIKEHAPEGLLSDRDYFTSIPDFNDRGSRTKAEILQILKIAADLVKPFAFKHSVTMATDIMSREEREEMDRAINADWTKSFSRWRKSKKSAPENPVVAQFTGWLDSFEERGWDTFWEELAECEEPECDEMRKELLGV